jgi:hypothetical protein
MEKYIGTKIILAEPDTKADGREGYAIKYPDGYASWSPKETFEKAYRRTKGMTFGLAIEAMKYGHKVARPGWNGKDMFLYYISEDSYPAKMSAIKGRFENDIVPYGAYIAIKTAQGNVVPWMASQTDVLAEDWMIVE